MSNQTEIAATNEGRDDDSTAVEAFAALSRGANGGSNEWEALSSRYRAVEEAHQLHEETLKRLREEIDGQRERLEELSRGAQTPARSGQIDVILMRLSELERKIGEGASDPLLNEIVHRLAALESNGAPRSGKDPRVDDLAGQLETLRRRLEEPASDPRTDDVVLRVAALEGAVRRASQATGEDELLARLDEVAADVRAVREAELSALRDDLHGELAKLREAIAEGADGGAGSAELAAAVARLSAIEAGLAARSDEGRLAAVEERLAALEPVAELAALSEEVRGLRERFEAGEARPDFAAEWDERLTRVERRQESNEPAAEVAALAAEVRALRARFDAAEEGPDVAAELDARLDVLESRVAQSAAGETVESLRERLASLETAVGSDDDDIAFEVAEVRVRLQSLEERLEKSRLDAGDGSRVLELAGRLHSVESKAESLGSAFALVDTLAARVAALETEARAGLAADGPEAYGGLREEVERLGLALAAARENPPGTWDERIEQLEQRLAEVEAAARLEDADGRLNGVEDKLRAIEGLPDLGRRLTVLEMDRDESRVRGEELRRDEARLEEVAREVERLRERLETAGAAGADTDAVAELRARIDAVAERYEALAPAAPANDPRVAELAGRLEWLERRVESSGVPSSALPAEFGARIEALERVWSLRRDETPTSPGLDIELGPRLGAIEDRLEELAARGGSEGDSALQRESERWSKWARSTLAEIGELRQRVEEIDANAAAAPAAAPIDVESVTAIGTAVSNALRTAEVKALRAQMYFVYLSIGMLWAILLYVLFSRA